MAPCLSDAKHIVEAITVRSKMAGYHHFTELFFNGEIQSGIAAKRIYMSINRNTDLVISFGKLIHRRYILLTAAPADGHRIICIRTGDLENCRPLAALVGLDGYVKLIDLLRENTI